MPRWVKVSGLVAVVLILLVIVSMLIGGNHGPARHLGSANAVGVELSTSAGPDTRGTPC